MQKQNGLELRCKEESSRGLWVEVWSGSVEDPNCEYACLEVLGLRSLTSSHCAKFCPDSQEVKANSK